MDPAIGVVDPFTCSTAMTQNTPAIVTSVNNHVVYSRPRSSSAIFDRAESSHDDARTGSSMV